MPIKSIRLDKSLTKESFKKLINKPPEPVMVNIKKLKVKDGVVMPKNPKPNLDQATNIIFEYLSNMSKEGYMELMRNHKDGDIGKIIQRELQR